MQQEQRPPNKYLRWVKFLDRVKAWFKDEPVHKDYTAAAYALADSKALQRKEVIRKQTETQYEGVHPEIVAFWKAMLQACKARNIPVLAFEMLRDEARQNELHAQGRSKAKGGNSPHQYGMAVDIVHAQRYWQISKKEWDILGTIGKEVARRRNIKIEWGGDWPFYDPAHWQLKNWRIRKDEPKVGRPGITEDYEQFVQSWQRSECLDKRIKPNARARYKDRARAFGDQHTPFLLGYAVSDTATRENGQNVYSTKQIGRRNRGGVSQLLAMQKKQGKRPSWKMHC